MVPQGPQLDPTKKGRGNVEDAFVEIKGLLAEYDKVTEKMGMDISEAEMDKAMNRMAELQDKIDAMNGWELDRMIDVAADALVLPPDDMDVTKLSGGER